MSVRAKTLLVGGNYHLFGGNYPLNEGYYCLDRANYHLQERNYHLQERYHHLQERRYHFYIFEFTRVRSKTTKARKFLQWGFRFFQTIG